MVSEIVIPNEVFLLRIISLFFLICWILTVFVLEYKRNEKNREIKKLKEEIRKLKREKYEKILSKLDEEEFYSKEEIIKMIK